MRAFAVIGVVLIVTVLGIGLSKSFSTRYSRGYSEEGFKRVEIGMSQAEVRAVLGIPHYSILSIYQPSNELAVYSMVGSEKRFAIAYQHCEVHFSNDVVVGKSKRLRFR